MYGHSKLVLIIPVALNFLKQYKELIFTHFHDCFMMNHILRGMPGKGAFLQSKLKSLSKQSFCGSPYLAFWIFEL